MEIFRLAEQGDVKLLWITATNPAVSLPELDRIRRILSDRRLFVIAQDIFLTETARLADVVLPAAAWGEKTGTFTNADRTVHISDKAVDPPGRARADLEILLDYARRMGFRDLQGKPLPHWTDAESAFEAWKLCSAGRPCDYSGLTYAKLRSGSGLQWPCNAEHPEGSEHLYAAGAFFAHPDYCESYGKDVTTGEPVSAEAYRRQNPTGKAMIKSAPYLPASEAPSADFPYALVTGRTIYHFHTRTKTARAVQLQAAAPDVWVEISAPDAERESVDEGDLLEVTTARGLLIGRARVGDIRPGVLFVPFHYGYWDRPRESGHHRAANELTRTDWDPASKQPSFKVAAASLRSASAGAQ
jgi:anaerobic selenocysteine-containing dehydrogenase